MPRATSTDISLTKSYIPKVSKIPGISPTIAKFYKSIENRNIHEGRVVDQAYYKSNNIERLFTNIRFDCLFKINELIIPRFILDFYSQVTVQIDEYGYLVISFMIQHEFITLTLAQFGQILKIPYNGQAVFTNEWDLGSLEYSQETEGPYSTDLPTPDDIRRLLELERVMVDRTIKSQTVTLTPNQILTKELSPDMKQWEELIRENVFGLGGHRDHLPACLAHMLYCVVAEEQYNLAYFFVKRIECARANPTANLPYGMFLTRLYRHIMEVYPHLDNGIYDIVDRVMRPLALKQTRRPRSDRGKARHSVSSSSSHHHGTSSHQHDDDDDDVETSRASTPSPTTYLNSLNPLNYQNYEMPSASEQTDETLFERQTTLLNQTQEMHKEMRGDSSAQSVEIDHLKQTLSEHLKEKESLMQTVTLLKNDFKKEESRNIDREIALEKRIKQLDNIIFKRDQSAQTKAQQLEPKLYDGNVIKNTSAIVIPIPDSEETLLLAEESHFETRFVPQTELSAEQAFWSQNSPEPTLSSRPTKVEVPKELPKVSMVNTSLKKLKHHLAGFDMVVKERTTPIAITEGSWGAVEQHRLESKTFKVKMNQVLNENERLLEQVISKDIVNTIVNSSVDNASVNVHECEKYLKLETELLNKKDFVKRYSSMKTVQNSAMVGLAYETALSEWVKVGRSVTHADFGSGTLHDDIVTNYYWEFYLLFGSDQLVMGVAHHSHDMASITQVRARESCCGELEDGGGGCDFDKLIMRLIVDEYRGGGSCAEEKYGGSVIRLCAIKRGGVWFE
ncbi:hypothetical protein Tco_1515124 [Tanacetum coccineum]